MTPPKTLPTLFLDDTETRRDGRNIHPEHGTLSGEGAQQEVKALTEAHPVPHTLKTTPAQAMSVAERASYYGSPMIKEPVWIWSIPAYFYVGGVAGAAGVLAGAVQLSGDASLRPFVRTLRWINVAGASLGGALLIHDLGRPSRFFNMLRVFRPTSPMSMGSWALAGVGAASAVAAVLANAPGPLRRLGDVAGISAALFCLPFTGYTAVLVNNTAVPVWQGSRRTLPFLFIASSMSSAAGLLEFLDVSPRARTIARRFGVVGKIAELAAGQAVMKELALPELKKPLKEGRAGALWRASKVLSVASLALAFAPTRMRNVHRVGGVLATAAAITAKTAVFLAGRGSARNPHATIEQQRQGRGAAEIGPGSTNLVQLKIEGRPLST